MASTRGRPSSTRTFSEPEQFAVFTLGAVAKILGLPKTRVKNWTIGRPLKIVPEISAGQGKGSRNLYSFEDIHVFALVNELDRDGFSSRAIKRILDLDGQQVFIEGEPNERFKLRLGRVVGNASFLVISRQDGNPHPHFVSGRVAWGEIAKRETGVRGKYILDLQKLAADVQERVAKFGKGRS
jgi:DNA-binding transcriptional MerR regulator